MGIWQRAVETYDRHSSQAGKPSDKHPVALIPISHIIQNAQIEIILDEHGEFVQAKSVPKDDSKTIIRLRSSAERPAFLYRAIRRKQI